MNTAPISGVVLGASILSSLSNSRSKEILENNVNGYNLKFEKFTGGDLYIFGYQRHEIIRQQTCPCQIIVNTLKKLAPG